MSLTRSVWVRRLVPSDKAAHDADPAAYQGTWESNPEGEIGEVVSETFLPTPDPENPQSVKMLPLLGVCWEETKTPPIAYEYPAFLENVDDIALGDAEDEDEEEEEETA